MHLRAISSFTIVFDYSDRENASFCKVSRIPRRKEIVPANSSMLEATQKVTPDGCASSAIAVTVSPPLT